MKSVPVPDFRGPDFPLTRHAAARMQQRGISTRALEALLEHGRVRPGPGGSEIVLFRKTYAVLGAGGAVLTVGHRTRRLPRD